MNVQQHRYTQFALCREMLQTGEIVAKLDVGAIQAFEARVKKRTVLLSGEGSSRIFPAKKTLRDARRLGYAGAYLTEGATQALEYRLGEAAVFVASNSGRTKECVRLIRALRARDHADILGIVAQPGGPVHHESDACYLLSGGMEEAVAATKSVVEQTLFYDILFRTRNRAGLPDLGKLGWLITQTLDAPIPDEVLEPATGATFLYWAGRNDGVAEELTLKTNEIIRRKSAYLEGTYAVHGVEEVMDRNEVVIVVDPFAEEEDKFSEVLEDGVGMRVVAIACRKTRFPTFVIPDYGDFTPYLQLAAGWNLLVELGVRSGIGLDRPERARKVGNEFPG